MSLLSAEHLVKRYNSRNVVKDVSVTVCSGEVIGLLGPNGAGKTTSFLMIVGLIPADNGSVLLDKHDLTNLPMDKRARMGIGYLPQEASIFRKLTVEENVMAVLQTQKDLSDSERTSLTDELLEEFHIDHLRHQIGTSLSGGERRRTEIARALALKPRFILLDEPFAGIDPKSVAEIQRIIKRLCERGIGLLITDHNVRETLHICDRAYIVIDGETVLDGKPRAILDHKLVRKVYLGSEFRL